MTCSYCRVIAAKVFASSGDGSVKGWIGDMRKEEKKVAS